MDQRRVEGARLFVALSRYGIPRLTVKAVPGSVFVPCEDRVSNGISHSCKDEPKSLPSTSPSPPSHFETRARFSMG
jgi:hypothetical protein